jgi:DNA (cytosine-5)-methyltransferase 1
MNELSLFSGSGGGLLGTKSLGFNHVGYVEWDGYCQQVIAQRIKDGLLDEAPIFSDVKAFASEGYASQYKGVVDVITAGFPCQPFSVAGKREASNDERNMWPATMEIIKAIRPQFCLLENVPGLLSATVDDSAGRSIHYFGEILRDLAQSGYDARWCLLGADDVGARHRRKRLWILAYSTGE